MVCYFVHNLLYTQIKKNVKLFKIKKFVKLRYIINTLQKIQLYKGDNQWYNLDKWEKGYKVKANNM